MARVTLLKIHIRYWDLVEANSPAIKNYVDIVLEKKSIKNTMAIKLCNASLKQFYQHRNCQLELHNSKKNIITLI